MGLDAPFPNEKAPELISDKTSTGLQVDEDFEALDGYVLDTSKYQDPNHSLKTTADGRIALIPQPSDSKDDPLNWSSKKKAMVLAIIAFIAFQADYTSGVGNVTVVPQAL